MRRSRRTVAIATVLGVLSGLVLGGTALAQDAEESPAPPVTFTVGFDSDITGLNPFNLCCGPDYEYLQLVYDLAIGFNNDDLSPAPMLVTSWEPNADSTEWTLTIRDDATWHDGQPLTSEDVAFTFAMIADNKMPFFKDYFPFEPTFETPDATTVIWKSTEPTFAPIVPAYAPVLPKHIWEQFVSDDPKETKTAAKEFENDPPIGSGPFKFAEWEKGEFLRFEANPDYWGGQPKSLEQVVFRTYQNQEAMAQALRGGEIDFAFGLKPTLYNSLEGEPNIARHASDSGCWENAAYNFGGQGNKSDPHPAIQDLTFRQAVAYSVDRQAIVEKVYQNTSVPGYSILLPGQNAYWYHEIPEELRYEYDPAKSEELLDGAGYLDTDADGIREMPGGGEPLSLEFMVITDVDGSVDTGKLMKGFLEQVGIEVTFKTVNTNKAYDLWYTGEWDVYMWGWCPDPDPDFMLSVFTTDQCLGWSDGCYSNPEFDELYERQKTQLDPEERRATIVEAQEFVARELPLMVLAYGNDLTAYRTDRFEGYVKSPNVENGALILGWTTGTYMNLVPVGTGGVASTPGLPAWLWIAIAGGIVLIVAVAMIARRKGGDPDAA